MLRGDVLLGQTMKAEQHAAIATHDTGSVCHIPAIHEGISRRKVTAMVPTMLQNSYLRDFEVFCIIFMCR